MKYEVYCKSGLIKGLLDWKRGEIIIYENQKHTIKVREKEKVYQRVLLELEKCQNRKEVKFNFNNELVVVEIKKNIILSVNKATEFIYGYAVSGWTSWRLSENQKVIKTLKNDDSVEKHRNNIKISLDNLTKKEVTQKYINKEAKMNENNNDTLELINDISKEIAQIKKQINQNKIITPLPKESVTDQTKTVRKLISINNQKVLDKIKYWNQKGYNFSKTVRKLILEAPYDLDD